MSTLGSQPEQFPPLYSLPQGINPSLSSYLEIFLIQDLLPPLDQEGSADVQVEMGESFRL